MAKKIKIVLAALILTLCSAFVSIQVNETVQAAETVQTVTGLAQSEDGIWRYYQNSQVDTSYNGLTYYYGNWYYIEKGVLNWGYTGLAYYNDIWYYVEKGILNWNYTGLTEYYGNWYYVENGRLNWGYTGLAYYNNIWYYVEKGILNWGYTGLTEYYGNWYYVEMGYLNWGYTGLAYYNNTWFYVEKGILNWNYIGLTEYYGNWYYVENGILNWSYSGIVKWGNENWRVTNGIVGEKVASHIVCIDAGHQAYGMSQKEPNGPGSSVMKAMLTTGTSGVATGQRECELNLAVALKLKAELLSRGYQVVMIREDNNCLVSNAQRAVYANNSGAEIFVRIHANGSSNQAVRGAMAYAPSNANPYMASGVVAASQSLTNTLLSQFCVTTGLANKGVLLDDTMTGINWCTIPVTIIEMGFLSNPDEDRLMATDAFRTVMARGIADGIDAYFGQ